MKTAIAIFTLAFLAIGPACAESAKSVAPRHHARGIHGSSFYAPGHEKKRQAAGAANKADREFWQRQSEPSYGGD
jgi:hypothetical protein